MRCSQVGAMKAGLKSKASFNVDIKKYFSDVLGRHVEMCRIMDSRTRLIGTRKARFLWSLTRCKQGTLPPRVRVRVRQCSAFLIYLSFTYSHTHMAHTHHVKPSVLQSRVVLLETTLPKSLQWKWWVRSCLGQTNILAHPKAKAGKTAKGMLYTQQTLPVLYCNNSTRKIFQHGTSSWARLG